MSDTTTLGQRIRAARDALPGGVSQAQLAHQLDVSSHGIVSGWENDRTFPTCDVLIRMVPVMREMGLDLDGHWLLTGEGEMVRTTPSRAEELVRKFRSLLDVPVRQGKATKVD